MYNTALEILTIIENNGYEAYIIGGYARDLYLGINNLDIDICTSAQFEELLDIFSANQIIYNNFGSMVLNYNNYSFEITTYRKEYKYEKNRFPKKIEFVNSLKEDLKRRDFIINTLCIDKFGNYIDLMGAREDLDKKIIRCVGNTDEKIHQDSLRILRAIRFATKLNFKLDNKLKETIKKNGYLLLNLSSRRKENEINKILNDNNKNYGLKLIKELELDKYI